MTLLLKSLELNLRQKSHTFGHEGTKLQTELSKWGTVGAKAVGGINIILALLEGAFGGLQVRKDWL